MADQFSPEPVRGAHSRGDTISTLDLLGVLAVIANAAAPTYSEGTQQELSTDLSGNLRTLLAPTSSTQINVGGTAVSAGAPFPVGLEVAGAAVAAGNPVPTNLEVGGAAVAAANPVPITPGTGAQFPVVGVHTNNAAAPVSDLVAVLAAVATTAAPTYATGDAVMLSTDTAGNLRVTMAATATQGVAGQLTNNNAAPAANNLGVLPAVAATAAPTYTAGDQVLLVTDTSGNLNTNANILVAGAAASGTNPLPVTIAGDTVGAGLPVIGTKAGNAASPDSLGLEVYPAVATTAAPTYTTGDLVSLSTDTAGNLRMTLAGSNGVQGTKTTNNAAPAAGQQLPVIPAVANAAAPTFTEGYQTLLSVDLSGNLRTLAAATQGGSAVSMTNALYTRGVLSNNAAAPGANNVGALTSLANAANPSYTEGNEVLLSSTLSGALRVSLSGTNSIIGTFTNNNAAPAANQLLAAMPAVATTAAPTYTTGNAVLLSTDLSGNLRVSLGGLTTNNAAPAATNVGVLPAVANAAAPSYTEGNQVLLSTNLGGLLRTTAFGSLTNNNSAPGSTNVGALTAVANAAGPTWTEGNEVLLSSDLSGRLRIRGVTTNNQSSASNDNLNVLPAIATTAAPTYTTGNQVALSTDLAGNLRVSLGGLTNNNAAPGANNVGVLPAIAGSTQSLTAGNQSLLTVDLNGYLRCNISSSNTLTTQGNLTNNNAAPAANNVGSLTAVANAAGVAYTEGNQALLSIDLTGRMRVRGVLANNGQVPTSDYTSVLPAVATTSSPTYTSGNSVALSLDLNGNLRTKVQGYYSHNTAAPSAGNEVLVVPGLANAAAPSLTEGFQTLLSQDLSGNLRTLAALTVGGAAVTAGNPVPVTLQSQAVGIQVKGQYTNNGAAPAASSLLGVLSAIANAAQPSWTEGNDVQLSTNLSGELRVLAASDSAPSITANGAIVSTGNPLPVGLEVGGAAVAAGNPVPTNLEVGGAVVSPTNPVPTETVSRGTIRDSGQLTSASLAAGGSTTIPFTTTPTATGHLLEATASSSVRIRVDIQTLSASTSGTTTTYRTFIVDPIGDGLQYKPPSDASIPLPTATGARYQLQFTNLDNKLAADVYGSLTYSDY
jgi:hypothetical protein